MWVAWSVVQSLEHEDVFMVTVRTVFLLSNRTINQNEPVYKRSLSVNWAYVVSSIILVSMVVVIYEQ